MTPNGQIIAIIVHNDTFHFETCRFLLSECAPELKYRYTIIFFLSAVLYFVACQDSGYC